MDLRKLKVGSWYKNRNILFRVSKKLDEHPWAKSFGRNPDAAYELVYLQDARHMDFYVYDPKRIFGLYHEWDGAPYNDHKEDDEPSRQYLYDDERELVIEHNEVKYPFREDFRAIIESIFERDEEGKHYNK